MKAPSAFHCNLAIPMRRWLEVWRQLKKLQEAAFAALPQQDMLAEVLRVVLRCACWGAAKSLLKETGPAALLPDQAEQIVISVARGFFYGADSLDAVEVIKVMLPSSN
jgi:hypothetical protein